MKIKTNKQRRTLLGSVVAISGAAMMPEKWQKPLINSVVLPAHAQMTGGIPIPSNVVAGPGSGAADCVISFDVVSDSTDINITSITNSALTAPDTIIYGPFGPATSTSGVQVIWSGAALGGVSTACNDPVNDVTFTVTYDSGLTATFTLFSVL